MAVFGELVSSGNRQFEVNYVTGVVQDLQTRVETKVTGSGGGSSYQGSGSHNVSISSTNTVKQSLFLMLDDGTEKNIKNEDFEVDCRPGQKLTVVFPVLRGKTAGYYTHYYNHNTREMKINESSMKLTVGRPIITSWLIFFVLAFVAFLMNVDTYFRTPMLLAFLAAAILPIWYYAARLNGRIKKFTADPNWKEFVNYLVSQPLETSVSNPDSSR